MGSKSRLCTLSIILVCMLLNSLLVGCNNSEQTVMKLEEFMSAYDENCSYKFSGAVLVAKGSEILLNEAFGKADYEKKIDNTSSSVFAIGSLTKSFTAIAIMQLHEKGLLDIGDSISKYIDGNKRGDVITIHNLLNHTSGMHLEGKFVPYKNVSIQENVNFINSLDLLHEPGTDHTYSNAGYVYLAAIIEKVSGMKYNDYIKENIFIPLEMNNSRCGVDASYEEDQAIGYKILTSDPKQLSIYNFSNITGSGNIYSTVEDMYKYFRGISTNKLLSKESMQKILSPQWGDWNNGYGYGWSMSTANEHKKISHSGCIGNGGYCSLLEFYPKEDFVMIYLTNNLDTTALNTVSESIQAIVFNNDYVLPEKLQLVEVADKTLRKYAGDYLYQGKYTMTVNYKDGKLYTTADDGNIYELLPSSDQCFVYDTRECTKAEFILDKNNNVTSLVVRSKTNIFEFNKVE